MDREEVVEGAPKESILHTRRPAMAVLADTEHLRAAFFIFSKSDMAGTLFFSGRRIQPARKVCKYKIPEEKECGGA